MSNPLAKKIIVISAVMLTIVLGAVVLALATGNTRMPEIDDPNGIFYERLDDEGKVIYSITNKEIYKEIKANDGITQLLMMVDTLLLEDYFASITDEQIENKIKQLTYGTDDDDVIADIDAETKTDLENDFARSMVLSGYSGNEEEYASLLIARENYAYEIIESELTEVEVATAFVSSYFEDIKAISIRFTSKEDAESVLEHFNLVEVDDDLAEFLGFTFKDDEILDSDDKPAEAYYLPEVFYFDEDDNLLNVDEEIVYTLGTNGFYTDEEENSYSLDNDGNLVDAVPNVVVSNTHIFDNLEDAQDFQDENTVYYYMSKTDPFDDTEDILIKDSSDTLMYTVKADGTVLDALDNDVTSTHGLIFNKEYKTIDKVSTFDEFNTKELNDEEVLTYYVKMYNYVYGEYRFTLPEDATKEEIIALGNKSLKFNFEDVKENSSALATYMFETISMLNEKTYSVVPKAISYANASYYYMTYKLLEPTKDNLAETVLDLIEQSIVLPANVVEDFELPTESEYGSKITWTSADKTVISNTGEVTTPEEATIVGMKYTITALGKTRTGTINVNVILTGENSEVTEPNITFPSLKSMIDDDIYEELAAKLVETKVYGSSGAQNISKKLIALRSDMGFKLYDYYLAIDYRKTASDFEAEEKGDKTLVASLDKTLKSEDPVEITADDLHLYALEKNPTIYTLYASQFKEMLYSNFYQEAFGTQRNIKRNSTARMEEMLTAVSSSKQYYAYIKSMYAQYGMSYPYETFSDYVYAQYGTKTELELLEYFIQRELQPYLINDILDQYNVVEELYDIVEDNYDNYFSLDVTHLLIFIDFDEDGNTDDYKEYVAGLNDTEKDDFNTLLAALEIAIDEFEGDFEALVKEYLEASREDETWGVFKQNGILLMTQELNMPDEEEENVTHSLNYSGQYGTKDTYAEEFTEALILLYQEYRLPQNSDLDELLSDLVITEFGVHLILAEQGEDFDQFSAKFTEDDANAIDYSTGAYNNSNKPTLAQMELYATYKFYEMVYDLSNADIEEKFNIVVPKIPASVAEALDFYFEGVLNEFYVLGTINVRMAQLLTDGNFVANDYTDLTNAELMANLKEIEDTYYDAIFSKYLS